MDEFNLGAALAAHRDELQRAWLAALAATGVVVADTSTLTALVATLTDQLLVAAAAPAPSAAAEQVVGALVAARMASPAVRDATLGALEAVLWPLLPDPAPRQLAIQVERLLRGVALGFEAAARETILVAQEQMRAALISARGAADQQRQSAEARLRAVIDAAPIAVALLDHDGVFQLVAGRALRDLQLTPAVFEGRPVTALFATGDVWAARWRAVLQGEAQFWRGSYAERVFDFSLIPILDRRSVREVLLLGVDVTAVEAAQVALLLERQRLAEQITEQTAELSGINAELRALIQRKDDLVANLSHELRTPLSVILSAAELLSDGDEGPLTPQQQHRLVQIDQSGRHLLGLMNDILDLAKLNAQKVPLEQELMSIPALCKLCVQLMEAPAQASGVTLSLEVDPQVTLVEGDERRLKQMLINLLMNAVKFTPSGGAVGLRVAGDTASGQVRFTVWDTGIGIAAEDQQRIFEPFEQADRGLTRRSIGTGLGLALVMALAQLHGGGVSLASELGAGSQFTVWLPWRRPGEEAIG